MARAIASGGVLHARGGERERCIALSGKGVPGSADLEEAMEAVARTARALRGLTRQRAHEWKPPEPEVRMRAPAGKRGGPGWTVRVTVPAFVTARQVHDAVADAAERFEVAKNIRLVPLDVTEVRPPATRPGRDRQPGQIRKTRGGPQHRARDLR